MRLDFPYLFVLGTHSANSFNFDCLLLPINAGGLSTNWNVINAGNTLVWSEPIQEKKFYWMSLTYISHTQL